MAVEARRQAVAHALRDVPYAWPGRARLPDLSERAPGRLATVSEETRSEKPGAGEEKRERDKRRRRRRSRTERRLCGRMSSPCLCRAPLCQTRLSEVGLVPPKPGREASSRPGGGGRAGAGGAGAKEPPGRSRSTPPVHRAQRGAEGRRARGKPEPELQPMKNGTVRGIPPPRAAALSPFAPSSSSSSSSSSASSTGAPGRRSPPPPARNMRRARWLSYSTSNIYNSILDGRFRQLQGTVPGQPGEGSPEPQPCAGWRV